MRSNVAQLFPDATEAPQEAVGARFEEWWALVPKKVGKPLAKAKYMQVLKGCETRTIDRDSGEYVTIELKATEQELIDGMRRYVDSLIDRNTFKRKVEDRYLVHPSTWINQGRWQDG